MGAEIPQNKPSLKFSAVLKMDTPPFTTVVVQSLNRVSCADTEEAQHVVSNSTHQGHVGPEKFLKSNHRKGLSPSHRGAVVTDCNRRQPRILDVYVTIHF
jgi:hypothetical protein